MNTERGDNGKAKDHEDNPMLCKKEWAEFREAGLIWWVNTFLHVFGWVLTMEWQDGKIVTVFPARTKFRGFAKDINDNGYKKVSDWMVEHSTTLREECDE